MANAEGRGREPQLLSLASRCKLTPLLMIIQQIPPTILLNCSDYRDSLVGS
jgi:hypothetical protein